MYWYVASGSESEGEMSGGEEGHERRRKRQMKRRGKWMPHTAHDIVSLSNIIA